MTAYSIDLRERVVAAVESGEQSQAAVAKLFTVSRSFVEKLMQRWRTTQDVTPRRGVPGPQRVLAPSGEWLRAEVRAQPDITLVALSERLQQAHGVRANHSMLWRELRLLNLRLKKSRSTPASARRRASKPSAKSSSRSERGKP
jgi:putative transposase